MTVYRGLLALLLAGLAVLAGAGPALAHTSLRSSTPADGSTLTSRPTRVSLTFGEAVTLPATPIRITGPGGATWTVGRASVTDATVSAPVTAAAGPAGVYTLSWAVVADDGDTITGKVTFTVRGAAEPDPGPAPAPAPAATPAAPATSAAAAAPTTDTTPVPAAAQAPGSDGGVPWWVWVVGAAVVLAAGAGGAVMARSRR